MTYALTLVAGVLLDRALDKSEDDETRLLMACGTAVLFGLAMFLHYKGVLT